MAKPIRIEEADSDDRTQIGEALTKFAVKGGRLETGRNEGRYFLSHADGCAVCGDSIQGGEPFYLDPSGDLLCERHGRERREETDVGE